MCGRRYMASGVRDSLQRISASRILGGRYARAGVGGSDVCSSVPGFRAVPRHVGVCESARSYAYIESSGGRSVPPDDRRGDVSACTNYSAVRSSRIAVAAVSCDGRLASALPCRQGIPSLWRSRRARQARYCVGCWAGRRQPCAGAVAFKRMAACRSARRRSGEERSRSLWFQGSGRHRRSRTDRQRTGRRTTRSSLFHLHP